MNSFKYIWLTLLFTIRIAAVFEPTLNRPFIFFHIPKTGGSSLRQVFQEHVFKKRHDTIIPCINAPCEFVDNDIVSPKYLNRSACAVAFLYHATVNLLPQLYAIDRGDYGPVACHRGWASQEIHHEIKEIDFVSLLPKVDCITVLREPISRLWSHYHFFKVSPAPFVVYANNILKRGPREGGALSNDLQSIFLGRNLSNHTLSHCHVGIQEQYSSFYSNLRELFPDLPKKKDFNYSLNAAPKVEGTVYSLSSALRADIARGFRRDGRMWAIVREKYRLYPRDPRYECDAVCWNSMNEWWLPPTVHDGELCQPCNYSIEKARTRY